MPALLERPGYDPEDDDPAGAPADPTPREFDVRLVGPEYLFYLAQARVESGLKELGIT